MKKERDRRKIKKYQREIKKIIEKLALNIEIDWSMLGQGSI